MSIPSTGITLVFLLRNREMRDVKKEKSKIDHINTTYRARSSSRSNLMHHTILHNFSFLCFVVSFSRRYLHYTSTKHILSITPTTTKTPTTTASNRIESYRCRFRFTVPIDRSIESDPIAIVIAIRVQAFSNQSMIITTDQSSPPKHRSFVVPREARQHYTPQR